MCDHGLHKDDCGACRMPENMPLGRTFVQCRSIVYIIPIRKFCAAKIAGAIDGSCTGNLDVFPGCGSPANLGELRNCLDCIVTAQVCMALNAADGLAQDCEALSCGIPVVANKIDGVTTDWIEEGKNGYLASLDVYFSKHLL